MKFITLGRSPIIFICLGILLLTHSMIFSAYLIHELIHQRHHHAPFLVSFISKLLLWICGCCYLNYEDLRRMHLLHHSSKADTVSFDFREFLNKHNNIKKITLYLEYFYFPAVEWIVHCNAIYQTCSFSKFIILLSSRCLLFIYFAQEGGYVIQSFIYYQIAYNLMLLILRFGDCSQHTYPVILVDHNKNTRTVANVDTVDTVDIIMADDKYEQENTYSNIFKSRFLNFIFFLNFGYHNAHHMRTNVPWFNLPDFHDEQINVRSGQILDMSKLIYLFHKNRIVRIMNDQVDLNIGFVGVSFLTDV